MIKQWMQKHELNEYVDQFGDRKYTQLAIDAVNNFDYADNSDEYVECFEASIDVLDEYIDRG